MNGRIPPKIVALALAAVLALAGDAGSAAPSTLSLVQDKIYAGQIAEAQTALEQQLAQSPQDDEARMALGTVQFLLAVENMSQSMYRYGLRVPGQGALVPFFRFPIPENPNPEPLTYEKMRGVFQRMVADLDKAEKTLAGIRATDVKLPLSVGLVRLDLNGDGKAAEDESLWRLFGQIAPNPGVTELEAKQFVIDFDASDVTWLRGYCNLLQAFGEFLLAYDWQTGFDQTFHMFFPHSSLPNAVLNDYPDKVKRPNDYFTITEVAFAADLIAFVHLAHWPVAEPERMPRVLSHLEDMVSLSRANWKQILAETDDDREWVPSPRQKSAIPGMPVTEAQVRGWTQFLDEFDALLKGKKLLPHWRLEKGINVRRIFLEPRTFDPVLYAQGAAALPYLEEGELTSAATWNWIMQMFEGNFLIYAVWFN